MLYEVITNNTSLSGCGNSVKYRFLFVAPGSSGDIELAFTNSTNNTLIFNLPIARTKSAMSNSYSLDVEVPVAFFNGQDITYNASNRITSYNVCYTKLLRCFTKDVGKMDGYDADLFYQKNCCR